MDKLETMEQSLRECSQEKDLNHRQALLSQQITSFHLVCFGSIQVNTIDLTPLLKEQVGDKYVRVECAVSRAVVSADLVLTFDPSKSYNF